LSIDELIKAIATTPEDTNKVFAMNLLGSQLIRARRVEELRIYADSALALAVKLDYQRGISFAETNIGVYYEIQGDLEKGLSYHLEVLEIRKRLGDQKLISDSYFNIGLNYTSQRKYSAALEAYRNSLDIRTKLDNKKGMNACISQIGLVNFYQDNYNEAIKNLKRCVELSEETEDKNQLSICSNNLGNAYRNQGNYPEALKYYFLSLKLKEELGNKSNIAMTYNNIGNVYANLQDYENSLKNHLAAYALWEEFNDKNIVLSLSGLGLDYCHLKDYTKAKEYLNRALTINEKNEDKIGIISSYEYLAYVFKKEENYSEALHYYLASLELSKEIESKKFILSNNQFLGEIYKLTKQYTEARQYSDEALSAALELGNKQAITDIYSDLADLETAIGNHEEALKNYKLYMVYKDSLLNEASNQQITQLKEQYESEKKDKDILQLTSEKQKLESEKQLNALLLKTKEDSLDLARFEKEKVELENEKFMALNLYNRQQIELLGNEKELQQLQLEKDKSDLAVQKAVADKKQDQVTVLNKEKAIQQLELKKQTQAKNYFIAGLVLFAILTFFIYRNYHTRQQVKVLTLRNKIASDLHDDIGSTLSSISIFSQMIQAQSKEIIPELNTIGESSRRMLDAMSDIVWTINPENDQFEKVITRMRGFAYEFLGAKDIDFDFEADEDVAKVKLSMEARKNLYLIFKEATNNMVKYAEADKAQFALKEEKDKLTMLIRDNGKGFDASKEMTGNGLKNMKKRALEMGAELWIDSRPGAGTTIKLELTV
jgi:signal transduction histidine kinase/tetratricopeptide (TPR) repeat protein